MKDIIKLINKITLCECLVIIYDKFKTKRIVEKCLCSDNWKKITNTCYRKENKHILFINQKPDNNNLHGSMYLFINLKYVRYSVYRIPDEQRLYVKLNVSKEIPI